MACRAFQGWLKTESHTAVVDRFQANSMARQAIVQVLHSEDLAERRHREEQRERLHGALLVVLGATCVVTYVLSQLLPWAASSRVA